MSVLPFQLSKDSLLIRSMEIYIDIGKYLLHTVPDIGKYLLHTVPDIGKYLLHTVPDIGKYLLHTVPKGFPESNAGIMLYFVLIFLRNKNTVRQFCYLVFSVSTYEKTPVKVLQGLVLANSHVFTEFNDSEESPKEAFLHSCCCDDAAVMWSLELLRMAMYMYIYIYIYIYLPH